MKDFRVKVVIDCWDGGFMAENKEKAYEMVMDSISGRYALKDYADIKIEEVEE